MNNDQPFHLHHPSVRAPAGSPADSALLQLLRNDFTINHRPLTGGESVDAAAGFESGYNESQYSSEPESGDQHASLCGAERYRFVMTDRLGRIAAAGWIGPRNGQVEDGLAVPALACADVRLYRANTDLAINFLQATQAYAFRRSSRQQYDFLQHGIHMRVGSRLLMQACARIGYTPVRPAEPLKPRNITTDMVVSSGTLEELNRARQGFKHLPTQKPWRLQLLKGGKGD